MGPARDPPSPTSHAPRAMGHTRCYPYPHIAPPFPIAPLDPPTRLSSAPCGPSLKPSTHAVFCLSSFTQLTRERKYWRQLDDFHSLTDLKLHVSSHNQPRITAGLRSLCWKVRPAPAKHSAKGPPHHPRSSSSSKHSTAPHGQPISATRARRTDRYARTTSTQSTTPTNSSPR